MKAYKKTEKFNKALAYIVEKSSGSIFIRKKIDFDTEKDIVTILKNNQFVENIYGWRKNFINIILKKDGVFINHNFNNNNEVVLTRIENPALTLNEWIIFFDRI